MQTEKLSFLLGGDGITVATTEGRGFTPEEIAEYHEGYDNETERKDYA